MKIFFLSLLSLLHAIAFSQKTETYYDFYWKPCRADVACYYSEVQKTDSGWLRRDIYLNTRTMQRQNLYEDQDCKIQNGLCEYYYANGNPSDIGRRVHGKQEGIYVTYHSNGMMSDSALYHEGRVVDKRFRWHPNGYLADSISRVNDTTAVQVGWFDDGIPAYSGYLVNGKQTGKWRYYHHNLQLSAAEEYAAGKTISATYFDEGGKPLTDTSGVNRVADFKGGSEGWKKYLQKHLYWPTNLKFTTSGAVTVGVDFMIDEDGKVQDARVSGHSIPNLIRSLLILLKEARPGCSNGVLRTGDCPQ